MATDVFYLGQTVTLSGTFQRAGQAVDPSAVTITVKKPDGSSITPAATKDATGAYHADITADVADTDKLWRWSMQGTGANPQIAFGEFKVLPSPLA